MGLPKRLSWLPVAILGIGIAFHALYVFSVITIYFQSPLVFGLSPYRGMPLDAPAHRLVLFVGMSISSFLVQLETRNGCNSASSVAVVAHSLNRLSHAPHQLLSPSQCALMLSDDLFSCPLADGLRADKFFERNMETKFLRTQIETKGSWGVSHTRVPTESRPGHVAMIAGFYEDVSAVTKGWKDNPVEFDSLFNRSRETWAWGSPDILPMFSTRTDHMTSHCYPPEFEDFGQGSALHLDTWVFDRVEEFFKVSVPSDPDLQARLRQKQIVFFLHLLGIDTIGHAKRPTSKEYVENILAIDKGIEQVVRLIEDFYKDDKTAYVFTSDHGMADRGVHGDGDPQNTETPLLVWGAGVSSPRFSQHHVSSLIENSRAAPANWHLDHLTRVDVTQADIAPLMSTLIGVPIPVNSVGVLPTEYLASSTEFKACALLDNAKEILLQYEQKEKDRRDSSVFFQPFAPLENFQTQLQMIQYLVDEHKFEEARAKSEAIIALALQGLRYYQVYDKWFLLTIVISGYLGFMAFTTTLIIRHFTEIGQAYASSSRASSRVASSPSSSSHASFFSLTVTIFGIASFSAMFAYLTIESAPLMYYLYSIFPFAFWIFVLNHYGLWMYFVRSVVAGKSPLSSSDQHPDQHHPSVIANIVTVIGSLLVVQVVVYGFHHREIFAVCFWALAAWGLFLEKRLPAPLKLAWSAICIVCSIFPLVPVDRGDMTSLLLTSGVGVGIACVYLSLRLHVDFNYGLSKFAKDEFRQDKLPSVYKKQLNDELASATVSGNRGRRLTVRTLFQIILVFASTVNVGITEASLKASNGLPFVNQVASWTILIVSFAMLVAFPGDSYVQVLLNTFLSLISPLILLSINFEVLFAATFFLFCLVWIILERYLHLAGQDQHGSSHTKLASTTSSTFSNVSNIGTTGTTTATTTTSTATTVITDSGSHVSLQHVRVAAIYILCCFFAFFGTGNLAGFSGFELSSAFRFQTLFDPFLMGAIVVFKILIPFILLCAVFGVLNRQMNMTHQIVSFLVVSILSDSMTLTFLLQVKDSGSWRDIGLSISNFAMLNFFLIFQMILAGLTSILLRNVEKPGTYNNKED